MIKKVLFIFLLVFLFLTIFSSSVVFGVNIPVSGSDFGDIRNSISIANSHDVVQLQNVTYSSDGASIDVSLNNIVFEGVNGGATVDGGGNRIFYVTGDNVTFRNINFVNGDALTHGAAIWGGGNNLKINNCRFVNNHADDGGAIALDNADNTIISNSIFIGNSASHGGAIGIYSSNVQVSNSVFINNSGTTAGAISIYNTQDIDIINSNFTGNKANTLGGAIRIGDATAILIQGSNFNSNLAISGGAVSNYNSGLSIVSSNFRNNNASYGGAINSTSQLNVSSSTFTNNKATSNGGAIYSTDRLNIRSGSTFSNNVANGNGGAIYTSSSSNVMNIQSSSFTGNIAKNGGAVCSGINLTISSSKFTSNTASGNGGGIYSNRRLTIVGGTFSKNKANNGGMIYSSNTAIIRNSAKFTSNTAKNGGAIYSVSSMSIDSSNFQSNKATANGGAIYSTSVLNISKGSVSSNTAIYGSGIFNSGTLRLTKVGLSNNNAKIFSIKVFAPSYVIAGNKINISSYLTTGDNLANAIYTKNTNVNINGISLSFSNKAVGKTIDIKVNNKTFSVKTSSNGIGKVNVPTSNQLSPTVLITASAPKYSNIKVVFYSKIKSDLSKVSKKVSTLPKTKITPYAKKKIKTNLNKIIKVASKGTLSSKSKNTVKKSQKVILTTISKSKLNSKTKTSLKKSINTNVNKILTSVIVPEAQVTLSFASVEKYINESKKKINSQAKAKFSDSLKKKVLANLDNTLNVASKGTLNSASKTKVTKYLNSILNNISLSKLSTKSKNDLKTYVKNRINKILTSKILPKPKPIPPEVIPNSLSFTVVNGNTTYKTTFTNLKKDTTPDKVIIFARVMTKKKINVTTNTSYWWLIDNDIGGSYEYYALLDGGYSYSANGSKEILVNDTYVWVMLSNSQLKEKYKWYYQISNTTKYYVGTNTTETYVNGVLVSTSTNYNQKCSQTTSKKLRDDWSMYVNPSEFCESDNIDIINLANNIKNSVKNKTDWNVANAILGWVQINIGYKFYSNTMHGALGLLKSGNSKQTRLGNCVDQAHLVVALLRAVNIPAKYRANSQFNKTNDDQKVGHAWVDAYIDNYQMSINIADNGIIYYVKHNTSWICGQPTVDVFSNADVFVFGSHEGNSTDLNEWCTLDNPYLDSYNFDFYKLENINNQWYVVTQNVIVDGKIVSIWRL
jgi:predicted outer membrane repeat protein